MGSQFDFVRNRIRDRNNGSRPMNSSQPVSGALFPVRGSLHEWNPRKLYSCIALGDNTGTLRVSLGFAQLALGFKRGVLQHIDSSAETDSLWQFVSSAVNDVQKMAALKNDLPKFQGDVLSAAFTLGFLNPNAVFPLLSTRALTLLSRLFGSVSGSYEFDATLGLPASAFPLGHKWSLFTEALRRMSNPEVKLLMSDCAELSIMKSQGAVAVSELKLNPKETRALNLFDGVRSLSALIREIPHEAETLVRTAFILRDVALVSFVPSKVPVPPVSTPSSIQSPVLTMPSAVKSPVTSVAIGPSLPMTSASSQRLDSSPSGLQRQSLRSPTSAKVGSTLVLSLSDLQTKLAAMKKQNFYEILGVPKSADSNAIKVAYLQLARHHHPDMIPQGSSAEMVKLQADVFGLISEANRTLSDLDARAIYLAEVETDTIGEKIDVSALLKAEEMFHKGCAQIKARKFPEAVTSLDEAIGANNLEPEFYAWRGYAKYFTILAQDKMRAKKEAQKDFEMCLKHNPNIAAVHYFMGHIAKLNDEVAVAKKHFQKCVSLQPNHVDAQRELRMTK
jgi:DnaJ-domain-containing protein 1